MCPLFDWVNNDDVMMMSQVLLRRTRSLAAFHTHDLHFTTDTARTTVM